jgi:uncharacterized metal-binding protein
MEARSKDLPLVYACSGCSSAAQMANHVALRLDRCHAAEMSCIAGVGGDVRPLVRLAQSGRTIIAIDGCPLACVAHCLARHGITPDLHLQLQDFGVKKHLHADFDPVQAQQIVAQIVEALDDGAGVAPHEPALVTLAAT